MNRKSGTAYKTASLLIKCPITRVQPQYIDFSNSRRQQLPLIQVKKHCTGVASHSSSEACCSWELALRGRQAGEFPLVYLVVTCRQEKLWKHHCPGKALAVFFSVGVCVWFFFFFFFPCDCFCGFVFFFSFFSKYTRKALMIVGILGF